MSEAHPLTPKEVAHVAKLARLAVPSERIDALRGQLAGVLGHVAKLKAIEVEGVEPMTTPFDQSNRLDPDEPGVPKRVQRGGSYLCSDQYCARFRIGTRGKGAIDTGSTHVGFRCVKDARPNGG